MATTEGGLVAAARSSDHPSLWRRTAFDVTDWFDAQALAEARSYATPLHRVRLLGSILSLGTIVGYVLLDCGARMVDALGLGDAGWALQLVAVLLGYLLVSLVVEPWTGAWVSLVYDKQHDISTQTVGSYVSDQLKGAVVSLLVLSALLIPVLAIIRSTDQWWLWGWAVYMVFQVALVFIYPVVIMPRFNKFVPLPEGDLRDRVEAVAARAGEEISGVFTMDASKRSRRDNAFVAGFGPTKRVVIFDTMLDHPPEVIEQVVAHEIGHYRLKHITKTVPFVAVVMLAVFWFVQWFTEWEWALEQAGVASIDDPRGVVLLLFALGLGFKAVGWTTAWYGRAKERQADLEALELLGDPNAFIDVWRRMAPKNKAELETPWWRRIEASHPEIAERMAFGAEWQRRNPHVTPVA